MTSGHARVTQLSSGIGNNIKQVAAVGGFDFMEDRPMHVRGAWSTGGDVSSGGAMVRKDSCGLSKSPAPDHTVSMRGEKKRVASLFDLLQELSVPPKPHRPSQGATGVGGACVASSAPTASSRYFSEGSNPGDDSRKEQRQHQQANSTTGTASEPQGKRGAPAACSSSAAAGTRTRPGVPAGSTQQHQQSNMAGSSKSSLLQLPPRPVLRRVGQGHEQRRARSPVDETRRVSFVEQPGVARQQEQERGESPDHSRVRNHCSIPSRSAAAHDADSSSSSSSSSRWSENRCRLPNVGLNPAQGTAVKRKSLPRPLGIITPDKHAFRRVDTAATAGAAAVSERGMAAATAAAGVKVTPQERSTTRRRAEGRRSLDVGGASGGTSKDAAGVEKTQHPGASRRREGSDGGDSEEENAAGKMPSSRRAPTSMQGGRGWGGGRGGGGGGEKTTEGGGGGHIGTPTTRHQGEGENGHDESALHRMNARAPGWNWMPQHSDDPNQWMTQESDPAAFQEDDRGRWTTSTTTGSLGDSDGAGAGAGAEAGVGGVGDSMRSSNHTFSQQQRQRRQHREKSSEEEEEEEEDEDEPDSVPFIGGNCWTGNLASYHTEEDTQAQSRRPQGTRTEDCESTRCPSQEVHPSSRRSRGEELRGKRQKKTEYQEGIATPSSGGEGRVHYRDDGGGRNTSGRVMGAGGELHHQKKELVGVRGLCRMRGALLALVEWSVVDQSGAVASTEMSFMLSSTLKSQWPQQYISYLEGKLVFGTEDDAETAR